MDPRLVEEPAGVPSEVTQLAPGETGSISRVPTLAPAIISGKPLLEVSQPQDGEAPKPEVKNESQKEEELERESEAIIVTASHNASDEAGAKEELHHTLEHLSNPKLPLEEPSGAKLTHDELFSDQTEEDGEDREDVSNFGSLDVCFPEATG
jgi:hypothetical protein